MKKRPAQAVVTSLAVFCVCLLFACTRLFGGTEKIADILKSPSRYDGKIVQVKGRVTESFIVFGTGYFVISDGTGEIAVVPSKTFPKVNEEVEIQGAVRNAFVIGEKSLVVILEGGPEDKKPASSKTET